MRRVCVPLLAAFLTVALLGLGCASEPAPDGGASVAPTDTLVPTTRADSVAYRLLQAHGADAWASAPVLRFDFGIESPNGTQIIARHLWNRRTGAYRIEWSAGPDSSYVALVNVRTVQDGRLPGTVYRNGTPLTGTADTLARERAYARFVNDTYWLLSPLKVFDPGVRRTYVADSSTATHDVLRLRSVLAVRLHKNRSAGPLGLPPARHARGRPAAGLRVDGIPRPDDAGGHGSSLRS
jgi:hypothetical protein